MRTLKLTHEQIELLQQALGIAEKKFTDIHKDIIENTVTVRGVASQTALGKENMTYFNLSAEFANLNELISNGNLDY